MQECQEFATVVLKGGKLNKEEIPMTYDPNNIFAKILRGEIPCQRVYEDEAVLAFHDIHPKAPFHVLVIPKKAYTDFTDFSTRASADDVSTFFQTVAKIAKDLKLPEKGFRLVANNGAPSGQEVFHFHVHLIGGKHLGAMA
jgi:histidine triad (HIT) family protein